MGRSKTGKRNQRVISAAIIIAMGIEATAFLAAASVKSVQAAAEAVLSFGFLCWVVLLSVFISTFVIYMEQGGPQRKKGGSKCPRPADTMANPRPLTDEERGRLDDMCEYVDVLRLMPYEKQCLLTYKERIFYSVLKDTLSSLQPTYVITVKPAIKEFVAVPDYGKDDVHRRAWREISQQHVDFLIYKANGYPVAAVEYDGDTHDRNNPQNVKTVRSDEFKDRLFAKLKIPLIRVPYGDWTRQSLTEYLCKDQNSPAFFDPKPTSQPKRPLESNTASR